MTFGDPSHHHAPIGGLRTDGTGKIVFTPAKKPPRPVPPVLFLIVGFLLALAGTLAATDGSYLLAGVDFALAGCQAWSYVQEARP